MPSIAIIIPNYNHGHLIEKSILSTFEQSVPPNEIIEREETLFSDLLFYIGTLENEDEKTLKINIMRDIPLNLNNIILKNQTAEEFKLFKKDYSTSSSDYTIKDLDGRNFFYEIFRKNITWN